MSEKRDDQCRKNGIGLSEKGDELVGKKGREILSEKWDKILVGKMG